MVNVIISLFPLLIWIKNVQCKLANSRLRNNNEILLIELITRPCKYELSVRIAVVLNEAILHRSSSFFCNKILLQISGVAHYNNTPLLNTISVYKTSLQD